MPKKCTLIQKEDCFEWVCPAPIAFLQKANEYELHIDGSSFTAIKEKPNFLCTCCLCPFMRQYEAEIRVANGGETYIAERPLSVG